MATIDKIAKQVGGAMKRAGMTKPAILTAITGGIRMPGAATAGTNPTSLPFKARGLVVVWKKKKLNETDVELGDRVVLLFGALIAKKQVPKVNDTITIEGTTTKIVDIERDAAAATYACLTR